MTHKERVIKSFKHQETDQIAFMYRDVPEVRATHNFQDDIPTENILAMYNAANQIIKLMKL